MFISSLELPTLIFKLCGVKFYTDFTLPPGYTIENKKPLGRSSILINARQTLRLMSGKKVEFDLVPTNGDEFDVHRVRLMDWVAKRNREWGGEAGASMFVDEIYNTFVSKPNTEIGVVGLNGGTLTWSPE